MIVWPVFATESYSLGLRASLSIYKLHLGSLYARLHFLTQDEDLALQGIQNLLPFLFVCVS